MRLDSLKMIMQSSNVKRYHIQPIIGEQNIAHHSWRLVMLLYYTVVNPSPALIKAALLHDVAEIITGDTPYTAKKLSLDLKRALDAMEQKFYKDFELEVDLHEPEKMSLKICDMLELIWFCREQIDFGNAFMANMFDRAKAALDKPLQDPDLCPVFVKNVKHIIEILSIPGGTIYE